MDVYLVDWLRKYRIEPKNINLKISFRQSITHYGKYPIHVACLERNKIIIEKLLLHKANLDVITKIERRNILHYCCCGNLELVKLIFSPETKFLLFIQDYNEMTPLDFALHYNKTDIIFYFIEIGLFRDNELLIKYLYRLEPINFSILTPIQQNKFNLLIKLIFDECLQKINKYFEFHYKIEPLFNVNYSYLTFLSGIDGLKILIMDYLGFNTEKIENVLQFMELSSKLLLNSYTHIYN